MNAAKLPCIPHLGKLAVLAVLKGGVLASYPDRASLIPRLCLSPDRAGLYLTDLAYLHTIGRGASRHTAGQVGHSLLVQPMGHL